MKRDADEAVAGLMKPMKREDVTDLIAFRKVKKARSRPRQSAASSTCRRRRC